VFDFRRTSYKDDTGAAPLERSVDTSGPPQPDFPRIRVKSGLTTWEKARIFICRPHRDAI
jgi:hypothetical protein